VSAGVRNLDGMADGRSGRVRQCLRQHHTRPHTSGRGPCRPDTDQAHRTWASVACGSSGSGPVSGHAHTSWHLRGAPASPDKFTLVAGVREAGGHPSARNPRLGHHSWPLTAVWSRVPDTIRPDSGRSGQWSFRTQRTVNPPTGRTRYNLLYASSKAGPAGGLRPPSGPQGTTGRGQEGGASAAATSR
jgi:hypothetical protein